MRTLGISEPDSQEAIQCCMPYLIAARLAGKQVEGKIETAEDSHGNVLLTRLNLTDRSYDDLVGLG
jgi:hypothetical protein